MIGWNLSAMATGNCDLFDNVDSRERGMRDGEQARCGALLQPQERFDANAVTRLRPISTARLVALHLQPINLVVFEGTYALRQRYLILRRVSHLDAFSGYL